MSELSMFAKLMEQFGLDINLVKNVDRIAENQNFTNMQFL